MTKTEALEILQALPEETRNFAALLARWDRSFEADNVYLRGTSIRAPSNDIRVIRQRDDLAKAAANLRESHPEATDLVVQAATLWLVPERNLGGF